MRGGKASLQIPCEAKTSRQLSSSSAQYDDEDDEDDENDEDDEDDDENDIQLFPNWPSSDDFEATTISLPAQELFYWRSESEDLRPMPGARIQKQKQSPFPAML